MRHFTNQWYAKFAKAMSERLKWIKKKLMKILLTTQKRNEKTMNMEQNKNVSSKIISALSNYVQH